MGLERARVRSLQPLDVLVAGLPAIDDPSELFGCLGIVGPVDLELPAGDALLHRHPKFIFAEPAELWKFLRGDLPMELLDLVGHIFAQQFTYSIPVAEAVEVLDVESMKPGLVPQEVAENPLKERDCSSKSWIP